MRTLCDRLWNLQAKFTLREPHSWDPRQRTTWSRVVTSDFNSVLRSNFQNHLCAETFYERSSKNVESEGPNFLSFYMFYVSGPRILAAEMNLVSFFVGHIVDPRFFFKWHQSLKNPRMDGNLWFCKAPIPQNGDPWKTENWQGLSAVSKISKICCLCGMAPKTPERPLKDQKQLFQQDPRRILKTAESLLRYQ